MFVADVEPGEDVWSGVLGDPHLLFAGAGGVCFGGCEQSVRDGVLAVAAEDEESLQEGPLELPLPSPAVLAFDRVSRDTGAEAEDRAVGALGHQDPSGLAIGVLEEDSPEAARRQRVVSEGCVPGG